MHRQGRWPGKHPVHLLQFSLQFLDARLQLLQQQDGEIARLDPPVIKICFQSRKKEGRIFNSVVEGRSTTSRGSSYFYFLFIKPPKKYKAPPQ